MFNNSSYASPTSPSQENHTSAPPSFLFGNQNKRRSVALSSANPYLNSSLTYSGAPSTDIFASPSPIPSHVKESSGGSGSKTVHWSPTVEDGTATRPISRLGSSTKGPPLRSMRDDIDSPAPKQPRAPTVQSTPSQMSSVESTPTAADHWVTVFGFPPNYSDKVFKLMSRHGEIVSQQVPARGNWVNIRYSCALHAQQALARNAALIDGVVRIGVVPCTDHEVMENANRSSLNLSYVKQPKEDENRQELPPPMAPTAETSFNASLLNASSSVRAETSTISRTGSLRSASRAGMRSLAASTPRTNDLFKGESTEQEGLMGRIWSLLG